MNKAFLIGRLTRDPEVRYSQSAEPMAITRFTLAVDRRFKREGEPDADFINCVAFGKTGEFAGKYFNKGKKAVVLGRVQVSSWEDQQGQKRWSTDIVVEEMEFAESKAASEQSGAPYGTYAPPTPPSSKPAPAKPAQSAPEPDGFYQIEDSVDDDDLPF